MVTVGSPLTAPGGGGLDIGSGADRAVWVRGAGPGPRSTARTPGAGDARLRHQAPVAAGPARGTGTTWKRPSGALIAALSAQQTPPHNRARQPPGAGSRALVARGAVDRYLLAAVAPHAHQAAPALRALLAHQVPARLEAVVVGGRRAVALTAGAALRVDAVDAAAVEHDRAPAVSAVPAAARHHHRLRLRQHVHLPHPRAQRLDVIGREPGRRVDRVRQQRPDGGVHTPCRAAGCSDSRSHPAASTTSTTLLGR